MFFISEWSSQCACVVGQHDTGKKKLILHYFVFLQYIIKKTNMIFQKITPRKNGCKQRICIENNVFKNH